MSDVQQRTLVSLYLCHNILSHTVTEIWTVATKCVPFYDTFDLYTFESGNHSHQLGSAVIVLHLSNSQHTDIHNRTITHKNHDNDV